MASIDIKDAHLHIPICGRHQCLLRVMVGDDHYQFDAFPFSLASAPRVYTKVLAPVLSLLRQQEITVVDYLDRLLGAECRSFLLDNIAITNRMLQEFGLSRNFKKSTLVWTRQLECKGMILDLV